jgi:hypothetical protein
LITREKTKLYPNCFAYFFQPQQPCLLYNTVSDGISWYCLFCRSKRSVYWTSSLQISLYQEFFYDCKNFAVSFFSIQFHIFVKWSSLWVIDGQANNFAILFQKGSERDPNSISKIRQMSKIQWSSNILCPHLLLINSWSTFSCRGLLVEICLK